MKMASGLAFLAQFCNSLRSQLSDQLNVEILKALCVLYKSAALPSSRTIPRMSQQNSSIDLLSSRR